MTSELKKVYDILIDHGFKHKDLIFNDNFIKIKTIGMSHSIIPLNKLKMYNLKLNMFEDGNIFFQRVLKND